MNSDPERQFSSRRLLTNVFGWTAGYSVATALFIPTRGFLSSTEIWETWCMIATAGAIMGAISYFVGLRMARRAPRVTAS